MSKIQSEDSMADPASVCYKLSCRILVCAERKKWKMTTARDLSLCHLSISTSSKWIYMKKTEELMTSLWLLVSEDSKNMSIMKELEA